MDDLVTKTTELLRAEFPGSDVEIETWKASDRLSGSLTWKGFLGKDQVKRQRKVWKALRAHLSPDEWARIAAIFTFTPAEMAVMREDTGD